MGRFKITILIGVVFLAFPFFVQATVIDFNVDPSYDFLGRTKVTAFLQQLGENAYFYIEDGYYQTLDVDKKKEFTEALKSLSQEFDEVIYPQLTGFFGSEWNPGIDNDEKITVLVTRLKEENGGYFNKGDEYPEAQVSSSNEREMVYLNASHIDDPLIESYLAHEFVHLITFNQKERIYGVEEETWLNEGRAEMAPTILGYDKDYTGSNLQKRVKTFMQKPQDPLTEWRSLSSDYGALNLFFQYLIDHYGARILASSLPSEKTGIASLNYALKRAAFSEDFSKIFTDWTITLLVNDCNLGPKYCYLNQNLKSLRIIPQLNYLPLSGESVLTVTNYAKDWAGNWYKFIGGGGTLKLEFIGEQRNIFEVSYVIQDSAGNYSVNFLKLDDSQRGTVYVSDFGTKYNSLTLIPSSQGKLSGFDGLESYRQFIWSVSIINENSEKEEQELIEQLLTQIASLQSQIAQLQARINAILVQGGATAGCSILGNDLYYGMKDSVEVRCLQQFLKNQGADVYPEGLVTGNFSNLTLAAVIRFQEKYKAEILAPLGIEKGTGYVGSATRSKINQLL